MDPIQKPPNEHWLENTYCLWSLAWSDPHNKHDKDYVNNLQLIASFGTVEQWWSIYSHLININYLPPYMELNLFKTGILPMWEDPANIRGGRWVTIFLIGKILIFINCTGTLIFKKNRWYVLIKKVVLKRGKIYVWPFSENNLWYFLSVKISKKFTQMSLFIYTV